MKRCHFIALLVLISVLPGSCAPVLTKDLMTAALREVPLSEIKQDPDFYKGKLFAFGGIIVETKGTEEGSLIEALYVAVDSMGYLTGPLNGRLLALYPKERGFLDPMIYGRDREITVAGEFVGIREGKIDELDYFYPLFEIKEIFLWEEGTYYYYAPYYYAPSLYFGYPYYFPFYWRNYPYYPPPFWWDRPHLRHRRPYWR